MRAATGSSTHGKHGKVVSRASVKGKCVVVLFPGNTGATKCYFSPARRCRGRATQSSLHAAPAARPLSPPHYTVACVRTTTTAAGRLRAGRAGLLHGEQSHLSERRPDRVLYGKRGEVVGPATSETHKGKGMAVLFPSNKGVIDCYLSPRSAPAAAKLTQI